MTQFPLELGSRRPNIIPITKRFSRFSQFIDRALRNQNSLTNNQLTTIPHRTLYILFTGYIPKSTITLSQRTHFRFHTQKTLSIFQFPFSPPTHTHTNSNSLFIMLIESAFDKKRSAARPLRFSLTLITHHTIHILHILYILCYSLFVERNKYARHEIFRLPTTPSVLVSRVAKAFRFVEFQFNSRRRRCTKSALNVAPCFPPHSYVSHIEYVRCLHREYGVNPQ